MRIISVVLSAVFIVSLYGCASSKQHEITELHQIQSTQQLEQKWSKKIGDTAIGGFIPRYLSGNFYAANTDGDISIIDALNGRKTGGWEVKKSKLTTGLAVSANSVYVGVDNVGIEALNPKDGTKIWQQPLTSMLLEAPLLMGNGVVVVRTNDGRVTGFDGKDGRQLWSNTYVMPSLLVRNTGSMSPMDENIALIGLPAGRIQAVNSSKGDILWEGVAANPHGATELERATDIVSRPFFDNGQIYTVAYQGRIACFDINSGNLLWSQDLSSSRGLVANANAVFTTADDGSVLAFDRTSGEKLWKLNDLMYRGVSAPVLLGDNLLVADNYGYVHLISPQTGALIGRLKIGTNELSAPPQSFGDSVLLQDADGLLVYVSLKN